MSLAVGGKTNINQTTIHRTMNWTNRNVRLFYSTGEPPRTLPAREANFEIPAGPVYRQGASFDIVAFADPTNRLVYVGQAATVYFETDSAIVGLSLGPGCLTWHESFVEKLAASETLDQVLEHVESKVNATAWLRRSLSEARESITLHGILGSEFVAASPGSSQLGRQKLVAARMEGQTLQLDLKNQTGELTGSLWVDTRTRKVVRATRDGKEVPANSPGLR